MYGVREGFIIFSSERFWTSPERGGRGFPQSRIKVRPYFGPFSGVFFVAFLGLLRAFFGPDNLGKTHLSPESAKKGGDQPFWTSRETN